MAIEKNRLSIFLFLVTLFQLTLWLNSLEQMTYGIAYKSGFIGWVIFFVLSISVLFFLFLCLKYGSLFQKIALLIFSLFLGLNIFLGFFDQSLGSEKHLYTKYEWQHVLKQIDKGEDLKLKSLSTLYVNQNSKIHVIGKERLPNQKYFEVNYLSPDRFESSPQTIGNLKLIVPEGFYEYRNLILKTESKADEVLLFRDFFTWQFPNYLPLVALADQTCSTEWYPEHTCFYQLYEKRNRKHIGSLWEELMSNKLGKRFKNIAQILKEMAGLHQYTRTDLENDSYFLIWQGRYSEARQNLDQLPPERRAFCEEKLRKLNK